VKRELGSWVSVPWPGAPNDEAFVHVSRGSLARGATPAGTASAGAPSIEGEGDPTIADDVSRVERTVLRQHRELEPVPQPMAVRGPTYALPLHTLGVGGLIGGRAPAGFGVSGRAWITNLGMQLNLSHYALESSLGPERLTSFQVEPSVLYSPGDYVSDSVWLRPYVGSGLSLRRQTRHAGTAIGMPSSTANAFGLQTFGGTEVTLAALPQFALSADAGYRWTRTEVPGFDLRGMAFSLSGHWYVR
jgi:hypothetical protein